MFALINTIDLEVTAISHKISHLEQIIKHNHSDPRSTMVRDHYTYDNDKYRVYHLPDNKAATTIALPLNEDYPKALIHHHDHLYDAELFTENEYGEDPETHVMVITPADKDHQRWYL